MVLYHQVYFHFEVSTERHYDADQTALDPTHPVAILIHIIQNLLSVVRYQQGRTKGTSEPILNSPREVQTI